MSKYPGFRRGPYDDILIKFLRGKSLSKNELFKLREKEESPIAQIPKKRLYSRLKQLEKHGIIKHVPDQYTLIEDVAEANPEEIQDCLDVINNQNENVRVLRDRIRLLQMRSLDKRIGHLPNVLLTFENCLENPKIINNEEAFKELNNALVNIIRFEQKHRLSDSQKIIERINTDIFGKIIDRINQTPSFPEKHIIKFLVSSRKKEGIDVFFKKIRLHKPINQVHDFGHDLGEVYPFHIKMINKYLDELLRSEDEVLQEIASKLREYLRL